MTNEKTWLGVEHLFADTDVVGGELLWDTLRLSLGTNPQSANVALDDLVAAGFLVTIERVGDATVVRLGDCKLRATNPSSAERMRCPPDGPAIEPRRR